MKKLLTSLALLAAALTPTWAAEWIDVTDAFIMNPRYDGDSYHGWEGTQLSGYNPMENAEHYQKTFNTYQTISGLTPGVTYRLSLNAFYRSGNASADYENYSGGNAEAYQYARLYAETDGEYTDTGIKLCSSGAVNESLGGATSTIGNWWMGNQQYMPNNMEAAYYWFAAGHYINSIEFTAGSDGTATIGVKKDEWVSEDWMCIDNWKLEYYGEVTLVSKVNMSQTRLELTETEEYHLTYTITPENATYKNVTWKSTNEAVAVVDATGKVTAVGAGTCYIRAYANDESGIYGYCRVIVSEGQATAESLVINEIMAANIDTYLDPSFNYGSWVELYNPTDVSAKLGGLYITDDENDLKKHKLVDDYGAVPAHGFAVLNFDHHEVWTKASYRQIDNKLDCDGGVIIISDGETILAQMDYPAAIGRVSYARTTDGGEAWGMTGFPSPGASNNQSAFATQQLDMPEIDMDSQVFTGSMQVCVNIPEGATLRFTTDGTAPSMTNGRTSDTGIFQVSNNSCYRFRLYKDGYLPSPVATRTYIYNNDNLYFPIISVVTDNNGINGSKYGVFSYSSNGRPGNGQTSAFNANMDWDRPVNFEYINEEGECVVSQECDFATCGGWSRAWTPHSFKLKANKQYDFKSVFEYQFFEEKPYLKHKTLQIRNGGNDTGCRIKDGALQKIVGSSGLYIDYQESKPVHVFINAKHYAVLNMREPNNKHYAYANYGIDTDEMDQFEMSPDSGYVQMEGTPDKYEEWYELSANAADDEVYEQIAQIVDMDEYINYMAVELYLGNWDWPQNNVKGFRDVNDGKFHFVLFDLDGSFSTSTPFSTFTGKERYTFDTLHGFDYSQNKSVEGYRRTLNIKFVTIFKNMLQNDTFRKKFIDTFCLVGGSVFEYNRSFNIVYEMAEQLSAGNYVNPWNTASDVVNNLAWRNSSMANDLKNYSAMKLNGVNKQYANLSSNIEGAKLTYNGIEIPTGYFDGYLFAPVTVKAEAPAGYRFVGWSGEAQTGYTSTYLFDYNSEWKYYDQGSLDGQKWTSNNYSSSWRAGQAPLGYGKEQNTTTAGYLPTYYFTKQFTLAQAPDANSTIILNYVLDDGMVLYVNGEEVGRDNMPSGNVSYNTVASSYAYDNPNTGSMTLASSLFRKGTNTIAVEVHNNSTTSSDILWDAELVLYEEAESSSDLVSSEAEYTLPTQGEVNLMAIFEPLSAEEMLAQGCKPVMVNEVSAANTMYVNDYFKKNDWIELYNTTDEDYDIAGLYISDNASKPQKYQVPSDDVNINTIIPAHGYKVIWADKLDNIGADIHTSFKLDADGGDVVITAESFADTLSYDVHIGTQSFGRYPDGSLNTYVMNAPTIGKSNIIGSYDTLYVKPIEIPDTPTDAEAIENVLKENGVTIAYVDGVVNIKSSDAAITSIKVLSTAGSVMPVSVNTRSNAHFATVIVANLPKGIYVARVTTDDGDEKNFKFIIR